MRKLFLLSLICLLPLLSIAQSERAKMQAEVKELGKAERFEDALKVLTKYLKKNPTDDSTMATSVLIHVILSHEKEAIEGITQLHALDAKKYPLGHTLALYGIGGYLAQPSNPKTLATAKHLCELAIEREPNTGIGYIGKAFLFHEEEEPENAIPWFEKAIALQDSNRKLCGMEYIQDLMKVGNREKAKSEVRKSAQWFHYPEDGYGKLSQWEMEDGNPDKALSALNEYRSLFLHPDSDMAAYRFYTSTKANIFDNIQKHDSALWYATTHKEKYSAGIENKDMDFIILSSTYKGLPISPNHTLTYEVIQNDEQYSFLVNQIKGLPLTQTPQIKFNWEMTLREDMKGEITLSNLEKGLEMSNYFAPQTQPQIYDTQTTVWVSQEALENIRKGKKFSWTIDDTPLMVETIRKTDFSFSLENENKVVPAYEIEFENGGMLYLLNDLQNPLILAMYISFEITLTNITKE